MRDVAQVDYELQHRSRSTTLTTAAAAAGIGTGAGTWGRNCGGCWTTTGAAAMTGAVGTIGPGAAAATIGVATKDGTGRLHELPLPQLRLLQMVRHVQRRMIGGATSGTATVPRGGTPGQGGTEVSETDEE